MTTHRRARQPRFVNAAAAAAMLAALTLLVAACGSSSSNESTPTAEQEQARAFAQCMRDNGATDFPDPDADGRFRGVGHEAEGDPKFRAAQEACRALAPAGQHENTGDPAYVEQVRAFSQCMRDNGVPDFPDPDANGRLRGAGHEQQGDPKFRAAMETCRQKLPGGGEHR